MPKQLSPAFQVLHELALKDNIQKYPLTPDRHRILPVYTDKNEKGLVKCITDFLKFSGHQAERISNKGTRIDERHVVENVIGQMKTIGSVRWNYSQQERGTADVSATIKKVFGAINGVGGQVVGVSIKIEIKIGKDTQKKSQKEYQEKIERAGGQYWIVKTFEDFHSQYLQFVA